MFSFSKIGNEESPDIFSDGLYDILNGLFSVLVGYSGPSFSLFVDTPEIVKVSAEGLYHLPLSLGIAFFFIVLFLFKYPI